MKIFVSWSGQPSREAAELMKRWLRNVIQEADVWVSSQDIGKGEKWSDSLWQSFSESDFGILMVTRSNAEAPWIMFEAGALAKAVKARVIPILCDLERVDIANTPLSQFQSAFATRSDILDVVASVNKRCARPLDDERLNTAFERWWPDFEGPFNAIKFDDKPTKLVEAEADSVRLDRIENALEGILSALQRMRVSPPVTTPPPLALTGPFYNDSDAVYAELPPIKK